MPRFYWSDYEIAYLYRTAKNKREELRVLAELNAVSNGEMAWKLWELGCLKKQPPRPRERMERAKRLKPEEQLSKDEKAVCARKKRDEWRRNGCCIWCGKVAAEGKAMCKWCLEKSRAQNAKRHEKAKRRENDESKDRS